MDNGFWTKERFVPMSESIKIKRTTLYILMTIAIIVLAGYFLLGKSGAGATGNTNSDSGSGEIQNVVLSMKNYNYYPNTITVKSGTKVRISLDRTVVGCYRGFVIRDFGINKYLQSPSDYVEFTPTKKGTFR
jgi:plastocyanin domain-containing protein